MAPRSRLQFLRPFTVSVFNRFSKRLADRLPGFGLLLYRGRESGREYRTPINVVRRGDEYVFALTYGSDAQWVKNIMAAGECELMTRGRTVRLIGPRLFHDPQRSLMPGLARPFLGFMRVTEFLRMRIDDGDAEHDHASRQAQ
jgi:deazaflavin-dependent oxidoreductase (nitroreductase family)